jgi:hypothetical protein
MKSRRLEGKDDFDLDSQIFSWQTANLIIVVIKKCDRKITCRAYKFRRHPGRLRRLKFTSRLLLNVLSVKSACTACVKLAASAVARV